MDLKELIKKEEARTKQVIQPDSPTEKKTFKKERPWLNNNTDELTIETSINNEPKSDLTIDNIEKNYRKTIDGNLNYRKTIEKLETKLEKNCRKPIEISIDNSFKIDLIVGLQKQALLLIFDHCKNKGSRETSTLGISFFTKHLSISQLNAHNVINELLRKGIVEKIDFKRGRGGWFVLKVNDVIWNKLELSIENLFKNYRNLTIDKTIETASSKLVSNTNTNLLTSDTNNTNFEKQDLLDVSAIDIEPLQKFNIMRKQLQDIKNQKLNFTTTSLQNFVDRFVIYTSDSKNIANIKSIPAVFVKMAQLASNGQDPLVDIETDTDRAIRERLERLKAKQAERLKQKQELMEIEFEEWVSSLNNEHKEKIAPAGPGLKPGGPAHKAILKNYFTETIWPEMEKNF